MEVITLLTDFGHRDSYVGVMKGVIGGISPGSQVVDLTHGIQPQAILAARFNLLTSYKYFPVGTIHVVVVDPGVGTQRVAVAAQVITSEGTQAIVAPDNGIFTGFSVVKAISLSNPDYWRTPHPSHTFHGRDIFAPAAAHLANGVPMEVLGELLPVKSLLDLGIAGPVPTGQGYLSSIQYIDHFGNLVTTIPAELITAQSWCVQMGERLIPSFTTYGEAELGTALALIGSHGYVEISVNGGNAAEIFDLKVGDTLEVVQHVIQ